MVLAFVALRPGAVTGLFESPYATPAPGGGPARELVRQQRPAPSPATLTFQRDLSRPLIIQPDPSRP